MNMRSLTVILGALSAFVLGACTVTSTPGGTGGSTSTTGGVGGSGGTGGATASSTGTGTPCDDKLTCADALGGDPMMLCEGPSAMLYDKYYACTCETGGACLTACGDNACKNMPKSADCTACLQNNTTGCAVEFEACSGDI